MNVMFITSCKAFSQFAFRESIIRNIREVHCVNVYQFFTVCSFPLHLALINVSLSFTLLMFRK